MEINEMWTQNIEPPAEQDPLPLVVFGNQEDNIQTNSPVESTTSVVGGLRDETIDLVSRIADLQQDKWKLEERVQHLEENGAAMADDLMQKSLIIQAYVMDSKADLYLQKQRTATFKEKMMDRLKLNTTEELHREINTKMQQMLEETLAKNMQLQKDLDLLSSQLYGSSSKN